MAVSRAAKDAPLLSPSLTARLERPTLNQLIGVTVVVVPTQTHRERLHKFAQLAE